MPDCKETSAQVPLYNEIQATTTFASLALFFFFMSSLQKSRGGARTTTESRARGRAAAKYYDVAAATDAHATSRDGGFLRATQRHRRDMQHHFGAQLKGSFRGTSGARLVPPRSGAPRSAESHRRENAIATSAKRASDKYFYKLRGPRQQRWRASSEVVTKKLGNSGRANARAHQERAECGSGGKPQRRNFLIIRVNVSGEAGEGLLPFAATRARSVRKSTCRIHNRKDAACQQAARPRSPGRVFTYQN